MKVYKYIMLLLTCFLLGSANLYAQSSGGGMFVDDGQNNPGTGGTFGDNDQSNPNTDGGSGGFGDGNMSNPTIGVDNYIIFTDANVKAICVANWDTNGDGELSEAEAAAVTSLGEVFKNNTTITSFDELQYFTGLTEIGENAFYGCSGLTSVTIPGTVTSLENSAFESCSSLTSVTIPNSVTSIGSWTFKGCSGLTSVTLGNNVTSLARSAFNNCTGLTSITIPESVTSIGPWAFDHCTGLTRVEFASIESLCNISFDNEYANPLYFAHHLYVNEQEVTDLVVPEGVTSIGVYAFYGCTNLTSVTLPGTLTSTGNYSFRDCTGLTAVHISDLEAYCGISFGWYTPLFYAHKLYLNDEEVTGELVIPDGITSVSNVAFEGCTGITSVVIPEGVTSIGQAAFKGTNITSVSLPESLTSISPEAFQDCSALTSVTCLAENVPTTGSNVFRNVPQSEATLYVPAGSVDAYKAAAQWKEFGNIIGNRIYIETDFTSQFPTDWQGWTGATGYTATQYAPMVTTNDGRTVQVCEKFNGGSADLGTVFKRTLTGLTNGTYRIELFGAASSTKGRDTSIDTDMTSSDEGDETAVYLYAKTANGTVKQYIPVHWATSFSVVATAVLNEVVVTDGTVEIGMYGEKKFTNWHVVQIKGVTALVDAEELHANTLSKAQAALDDEAYANVTGEERTALSQAIDDHTTVSERTAEAYQAAITALETATKTFTDAKASYDGLAAAKAIVDGRSYPYATETKKSAAEDAAAAVATSATDAASKTDALLTAYRQYAESSALMEGIENAEDVTATYISNPKAEEGVEGWTTVLGEGSGGSISIRNDQPWTDGSGGTSHKYFDGGNYGVTGWDVAFKQDITLPAGRYQLTAIGRSAQDVTLTLFAGDETAEMAHINADGGLFNLGWEQTSVEFELIQEATVSIGVRGVTSAYHKWMSFSEFRLVQFPESVKIISFADANVKAICVANWDTNENGELNEDEAAAVTDLGEVFKNNTTITSFDELQYFTGLTTIGNNAFDGCSGLTSVILPNNVTCIANNAFSYCSSLTSISVPNSLTSIGNSSFWGCSALTSFTIPENVTSIGYSAFDNCSGLTSVTIPNSVTSIGRNAFSGCSSLTSISVAPANTKYDNRNNCNAIIETESNVLIAGCKNTVIPENVTSIGESAFTGSGLTSITIPENVTSIGRDAFSNCSDLTSITIPNSVTSIDFAVFWGCSNLTSVTIPNSVTSIDVLAFHGCSSLTSVISEIEEPFAFGEDAFSGISSECVLIVPAGKTNAYIAQGWTEDVFQGGIIEEAAAGNNLTLADAYGLAGAQCTLPISMSNTESIKGLQFDLRLSEGVTVATNEDDELMFTLTSRAHASHAVSATHLSNGDYRVVVSSLSAKTFKDTEGVIMNVTLSVDKNLAAGDYEVKLLSIVQNTANNVSIKPSDVTATLTISDVAPGDANGDGEINVTDVGMVIDHILENTPSGFIAEAADVNGDGEINVTDVGLIIDIILSDNYAREALIEDVEEIVEPE